MASNFFDERPNNLCKMCGMCCKVATSGVSYGQMQLEAKNGAQSSIDFLTIFRKYESYEEAYKVNPTHVENVKRAMQEVYGENFVPEFYYCIYLNDDNSCKIYENRYEVCKRAPASPWMLMAPECGYNDWLKEQRAKHMKYVIELKEIVAILKDYPFDYFVESKEKTAGQLIEEYQKIIDSYKRYGSDNW